MKLLVEHRYVESVGIEPGDVASHHLIREIACNLTECRAVSHILIGDVVDGGGFGRDGIPGLMRRVRSISSPLGIIFMNEISTIRSVMMLMPVVSRSKNIIGRFNFNSMLMG